MAARKPTLYNRLLKQFTKINNQLPEERKLSISERRKIIRVALIAKFKNVPHYKLRVKAIKETIFAEYEKVPPKEACDLNYIDPSIYGKPINWFEIDDFLKEKVLDCIYVRVNAGQFGTTKIFNTRDYDYYNNGVQVITERIREVADNPNKRARIYPVYSGIQKLKPRKRNDGTPENYFLDMVLYINNEPLADEESTKFALPKTKEVRQIKKKIKNVLDDRFKELELKKQRKKRAKKSIAKNLTELKKAGEKLKRSTNPHASTKMNFLSTFNKASDAIDKKYELGLITKAQFEKLSLQLLNNISKLGLG